MSFDEYLGNERIVRALRSMLGRERVPSALLFTGPRGIGKYTLARMFAQAANRERLKDDFCGECPSCRRMAPLSNPTPLIEAGLAERGAEILCVPNGSPFEAGKEDVRLELARSRVRESGLPLI